LYIYTQGQGPIKGRPSLISNFTTFSALELCPCLLKLEGRHPCPMDTFCILFCERWVS